MLSVWFYYAPLRPKIISGLPCLYIKHRSTCILSASHWQWLQPYKQYGVRERTCLSEAEPSQSQDIHIFHMQRYADITQQNTVCVSFNTLKQRDVSVKLCKFLLSRFMECKRNSWHTQTWGNCKTGSNVTLFLRYLTSNGQKCIRSRNICYLQI
jgi:hypothetical protein